MKNTIAASNFFFRTVEIIRNQINDNDIEPEMSFVKHIKCRGAVLSVPVLPDDTIEVVRNNLQTAFEIILPKRRKNITGRYFSEDVKKWGSHKPSDSILDEEALPFSEEKGVSPTVWRVQVIDLANDKDSFDLYKEMLYFVENKNFSVREMYPDWYWKEQCWQM